jgi:cysteine sulfinate desulfinase/cysteine desulfurase-like protein
MGIGACYVRRRPRVRIDPIISGGGQERGLRSGTIAPALVIGFGEAARICNEEMKVRYKAFPHTSLHPRMIIRFNMHGFLSRTLTGDLFAEIAYVTVMTPYHHIHCHHQTSSKDHGLT